VTEPSGRRRDILSLSVLLLAFLLVYAANIHHFRLEALDYVNLTRLREAFSRGAPGLWGIVDNSILAEPRAYFFSWLVQGLAALAFGFAPAPHFGLVLLTHLSGALLVLRIARGCGADEPATLAAALLYLLFPTATDGVLTLNSWFFVLPSALLVLLVHLLLFPLRNRLLDLACVSGTALIGQFSGEQSVPLFYAAFLWYVLQGGGARDEGPKRRMRRVVLPCLLCLASWTAYWALFTRPYASGLAWDWSPRAALLYSWRFLHLLSRTLLAGSRYYGELSVRPGPGSIASSAALLLLLAAAFRLVRPGPDEGRGRMRPSLPLSLAAGLAASMLPCVLGALGGLRPDPIPRYLYIPGLFLGVSLAVLADRLPSRRLAFVVAAFCAGSLTIYQERDVWGAQARADERIWEAVDPRLDPGVKYMLLDNPASRRFMPLWHSAAPSDFTEGARGYALRSRLRVLRGLDVRPMSSWVRTEGEDVLLKDWKGALFRARKSEILAVVFQPGARLADLPTSPLAVFRDFDAYRSFKKGSALRPSAASPANSRGEAGSRQILRSTRGSR